MEKAKEQNDPGDMTFDQFVKRPPELTILTDHPLTAAEAFDADAFNFHYKLGPVFDILRHPGTKAPMAILISGGWGTGKTSAMKWLQGLLDAWNKAGPTGRTKVQPVWFYPWKYDNKEDVRGGLIAEVIINAVYIRNPENKKITISSKKILTGLKLLGSFGVNVVTDLVSACEYEIPMIPGLKISGEALKQIKEHYSQAAHPEAAFLNKLEEAMKYWVKESLGKNQRMIIFIDDLDRCMPDVALMVLESIKLYLNIPSLMFVLGVDKQVIGNLVVEHYTKLGLVKKIEKGDSEDDKKQRKEDEDKARLYLSKMFQVEVELDPTEQQISDFFEKQLAEIPYWTTCLSDLEQQLFRDLVLVFAGRNPREVKRLLNSALMKGAGSVLIKKDGIKFNQGLQLFFVRKILDKHGMASDAGSKRGIEFFVQWSQIIRNAQRNKDEKFPLTVKISDEVSKKISQIQKESAEASEIRGVKNPELVEAYLNEALTSKLGLSSVPKEYLKLFTIPMFSGLFHLLADNDLGRLMQIPYPPEVAEIADVIGTSKDVDIIREAMARALLKKPDELTDSDYNRIKELDLPGTEISDLSTLESLAELEKLSISRTPVNDIDPLKQLKKLHKLYLHHTKVSDIGPLEGITSLRELDLGATQVKEIDVLAKLTDLQRLSIQSTQVVDISVLVDLANIQALNLGNTQINDIGVLAGLTKLQWLHLGGTQVGDIIALANLTNLQELSLSGTQVNNIGALSGLTDLHTLDFSGTKVSDLKPLKNLIALQDLLLHGTDVSDLEPLRDLTGLQRLGFKDTAVSDIRPLRNLIHLIALDLIKTNVSDVEPLRNLCDLRRLYLSGTGVTDIDALSGLTNLQRLELNNTKVSDIGVLAGLTNLQELYLSDTKVSNLEPLRNLTSLKDLLVHSTDVSDLEPLRDLTGLVRFGVKNTPVSDAEPLKNLSRLQAIDLNGTKVSDVEPLCNLSDLRRLYLSGTQVSDIGVLAKFTNLQSLDLRNTKVSDISPLSGLRALRSLKLSGTPVGDEQVADLEKALPKLEIRR